MLATAVAHEAPEALDAFVITLMEHQAMTVNELDLGLVSA